MAIFDRLAFLEGEQAEAYKTKKAREEANKERKRQDRETQRYSNAKGLAGFGTGNEKADEERSGKAQAAFLRNFDSNNKKHVDNQRNDRDAINRNMRRHPERWNSDGTPKRESTIFESVRFMDSKIFILEAELLDEEILSEQIVFKFVKKDQVPSDFKDEAIKILEVFEKESGKKASEGFLASTIRSSFGIRVNNARKKIEKGKIKNCYILSFNYSAITKAAGVEQKVLDKIFINGKLIQDYMKKVMSKLNYKKLVIKWDRMMYIIRKEKTAYMQ